MTPAVRRSLQVVAGVVVVALTGVLVAALALERSLDRSAVEGLRDADLGASTDAVDLPELDGAPLPDGPDDVRFVLVAGLDDRSVLTREERSELSTGHAEGARTEAIALVRVDPSVDHLDVLRLPRDLLVTRCDGSRGRLNAAYGIGERDGQGGASCLVRTITRWSAVPIDHVVEVDFRGFVDLVDAVDGVTLRLDEPLRDHKAGLDLPAGQVHVDGADALAFVRARSFDSDLGRIDRQQELVAAALDQVASRTTLTDPSRLQALAAVARDHLTFDDRMSLPRLLAFARVAAEVGGDDLVTRTVPGTVEDGPGPWFLHPDEDAAQELFAQLRDGGFVDEVAPGTRTAAPSEDLEDRSSQDEDVGPHTTG